VSGKITGVIFGVRIQEIEHPLMGKIRCMDRLVDELAKGRPWRRSCAGDAEGTGYRDTWDTRPHMPVAAAARSGRCRINQFG
jgi:hypothetical protein